MSTAPNQTLLTILSEIEESKGENPVILDLGEHVSYTDYFVLVTGGSDRHIQAMADRVYLRVKKELGLLPLSYEGQDGGDWVLIDYGSVVAHFFLPQSREYYDLEGFWDFVPKLKAADMLKNAPERKAK